MQKDKNYLSKEKYEELTRELDELRTSKRREVAERLEAAKALGDLSENAEYHAAREDQADLEGRILQLEAMLKDSEIVKSHHSVEVEVGSTLTVKRAGNDASERYTIVGAEEVDVKERKISYQSPLGSSLLGKKKGQTVSVKTPKGETEYTVVEID